MSTEEEEPAADLSSDDERCAELTRAVKRAQMRIEEMTADQPADPRPAIHDDAAEFDAQVRVHYDRYEAQLAAIRQLHERVRDYSCNGVMGWLSFSQALSAILDGVPGTTQAEDGNEADS